jgi:hypothetical protein
MMFQHCRLHPRRRLLPAGIISAKPAAERISFSEQSRCIATSHRGRQDLPGQGSSIISSRSDVATLCETDAHQRLLPRGRNGSVLQRLGTR